jgi:NADPH-dependent curcumin reductase CurA
MPETNARILLARRPKGAPVPEDFRMEEAPVPDLGEDEVLVRHRFISLDPYQRGRMDDAKSYAKPVALGGVMECQAVGQVAASRHPRFRDGDWVLGGFGWQAFSARPGDALIALDPAEAPPSTALGVLGMPGLTAWVGLADIGQPRAGETLVVSAASGAVGQVVGQLGRIAGARVVGIAGGAAKCAFLTGELGFDAAIDHRAPLDPALDAACPRGVDVYWENVGGAVQAAVFPRLNDFGRMVMCGMVAQYNTSSGAAASARRRPQSRAGGAQAAAHPGLHRQRHRLGPLRRLPRRDARPHRGRAAALEGGCGAGPRRRACRLHRPAGRAQFRQARRGGLSAASDAARSDATGSDATGSDAARSDAARSDAALSGRWPAIACCWPMGCSAS